MSWSFVTFLVPLYLLLLVASSLTGNNTLLVIIGLVPYITFRLPKEAAPRFPEFFAHLDEVKESMGIDSYGVSLTTLEEVFLRIGLEEKEREEEEEDNAAKELTELGKDQVHKR